MSLPTARVSDLTGCPAHGPGTIGPPGQPSTLIGGSPASRLAETVLCVGPDAVKQGAASVLIGGLPATRSTDATVHSALVGAPCEATVLIGGPVFSVPPNFVLNGDQQFLNKTIRDLYYLWTLASGRDLLEQHASAGQPVEIVQSSGIENDCDPTDEERARAGLPTGSRIRYNPDYRTNVASVDHELIPQPPQLVLGHELVHALRNAQGTQQWGIDPNAPPSEPNLRRMEAAAIGVGSYEGDHPTENSTRDDAGLPLRRDHLGTGGPVEREPPPLSLRPGTP
jgi:uncharacterized Zn-binding protein involved in type VI secretion